MIKFLFKLFVFFCVAVVCWAILEVIVEDSDEGGTSSYTESSNDNTEGKGTAYRGGTDESENRINVSSLTESSYRTKVADYTVSKTSAKKGINAVVLVYSDQYDKSVTMLKYFKEVCSTNEFYNYYSLELSSAENLVSAYQLTEVPVLIVASNSKISIKVGTLGKDSLKEFLNSLE